MTTSAIDRDPAAFSFRDLEPVTDQELAEMGLPHSNDPAGPLTEDEAARLREVLGVRERPEPEKHGNLVYRDLMNDLKAATWKAAQNTDALLAFASARGWGGGPSLIPGGGCRATIWKPDEHEPSRRFFDEVGPDAQTALARCLLAATEGEGR